MSTTVGEVRQGRAIGAPAPAAVSAAVAAMVQRSGAPGASLVVVSGDELLHASSYGFADLDRARPVHSETAFLWFSMSKLVTATAALRLAEDGVLDLDAPVDAYLDLLRAPGPVQPTLAHLLSHTAGLANPLPVRWVHRADAPKPSARDLLRRTMARRSYRWPVGDTARYTNLGYLAAGEVMAAATGDDVEGLIRRTVLDPLGMHQTDFSRPAGVEVATGTMRIPRVATAALRAVLPGHLVGARRGGLVAMEPFYVDGPAYGGLVGGALDAGRFLRMHLNDGELDGVRVLRPETARRMRTIDRPGTPFDHGIGWFRRPTASPERWVEHLGSGIGYWNVMRLYPDRGLGVVIMSNGTRALDFEPVMSAAVEAAWR